MNSEFSLPVCMTKICFWRCHQRLPQERIGQEKCGQARPDVIPRCRVRSYLNITWCCPPRMKQIWVNYYRVWTLASTAPLRQSTHSIHTWSVMTRNNPDTHPGSPKLREPKLRSSLLQKQKGKLVPSSTWSLLLYSHYIEDIREKLTDSKRKSY